ncbi:MAG: hypothetical protein ACE5LV_11250, partial [Candidatus Aminicenantales bacterium]
MGKIVDIYMPLDSREGPNREVWPVARKQVSELISVIKKCGWEAHALNPEKPITSVAEGLRVIQKSKGDRFIDFMGGWAYPDFSVTPMWQLPKDLPKLMIGSAIPDYPGCVGLFAAQSGTSHMGLACDRLFVENFEDHETYIDAIRSFLETGRYAPPYPETIDVDVADTHRARARAVRERIKGSVYGAVGPRSMQMWNKISEADFL